MASSRRLNPGIRPTDIAWEKIYAMFEFQVRTSGRTLGDILLDHFTAFEIRLFFKQERPDLKALQEQNTTRYSSLLNDRFANVPSSLPTKLAMMFFGLPIEPVTGDLEGKSAETLAALESEVAHMKPLAFLKNDDLSRVSFGNDGPSQVKNDTAVSRLEHTDVPVTSKSVLTVREQVNLLKAFREMRETASKRSFPCPFDDCEYIFDHARLDDAKAHISRLHVSKRCIWCNETHFEWWTTAQRQHHLRHTHRDELFEALGVENLKLSDNIENETFSITLTRTNTLSASDQNLFASQNAPPRHAIDYFCDSCGRDNRNFTSVYEKEYHDRSCRNRNLGDKKRTFCVECGEYGSIGLDIASSPDAQLPICGHNQNTTTGQFCILCGIDTDILGNFAEAHRTSCRGTGSVIKPFCPFCGDRLVSDDYTGEVSELIRDHRAECSTEGHNRRKRARSPTPPRQSFVSRLTRPVPLKSSQPAAIIRVDAGAERGRPQKQAKKRASAVKKRKEKAVEDTHRRRAPSPDWAVVLGDPDPSFVPDNNYYCSKCLRRVSKPNRRRNATATINVEHEYLQHIAKDRCCRIRNGIGSEENLPNRSGWIPAKLISKIGVMKSKFLAAHPSYKETLYPLLPSDARTNMWRSDPNNETNSDNWNLPWPPYFESIPELNNETSDVEMADSSSIGSSFEPGEEGDAWNKKLRRVRHEDGSYSYETCSDSDSEPEAEGSGKKQGKRCVRRVRNDDGTYMYETDPDSDSGPEGSGRARKKWKRRVRNEDGTYSYETEPDSDFEPEAARGHKKKRKRRVRHEGGVWYSYETDPDYSSDAQAGAGAQKKDKRRVRRVRNEDGTYSYETDPDSDSALEGNERAKKKWKRRVRNQDGTYTYETDSDFDSYFEETRGAGKKRMRRILTADGEWSYVSDTDWEDALSTDDDGLNPNRRRRRRRRYGDPNYQPPRKGEESDSDQEIPLEKVREELLKEMQSIQDIQDEQGAVKSPRFVTPAGLEDFVVGPSHDI